MAASDGEGSPTSSHSSDGLSPVFESHYDRPSSAGSDDAELQHAGAAASWQYASATQPLCPGYDPLSATDALDGDDFIKSMIDDLVDH